MIYLVLFQAIEHPSFFMPNLMIFFPRCPTTMKRARSLNSCFFVNAVKSVSCLQNKGKRLHIVLYFLSSPFFLLSFLFNIIINPLGTIKPVIRFRFTRSTQIFIGHLFKIRSKPLSSPFFTLRNAHRPTGGKASAFKYFSLL